MVDPKSNYNYEDTGRLMTKNDSSKPLVIVLGVIALVLIVSIALIIFKIVEDKKPDEQTIADQKVNEESKSDSEQVSGDSEPRNSEKNADTVEEEESRKETEEGPSEPEPQKTIVPPANISSTNMHGFVNSPEGLNVRYGPGQGYDIIETLPNQTAGVEAGWDESREWVYIKYADGAKEGWVKSEYFMMSGGKEKPVIYLYPTRETDVRVRVRLVDGVFTHTIPFSKNGEWCVTASPNGKLTDKSNGNAYDYIFWESSDSTEYDWSQGYVVKGLESERFLRRILPQIGLNAKESSEFIEYWLPRLQRNKYNLVTFQTTCYTDAVKMDINPKPDSELRVFMAFKEVQGHVPVEKPIIVPFKRKGFTVVEWGGAEVRE